VTGNARMKEIPLNQNGIPLLYRRLVDNLRESIYLNTCVPLFSKTFDRKKFYCSEYLLSYAGNVRRNACRSSWEIIGIFVRF